MNRLFAAANQFCKESDWKTIAALKFCLLSLGVVIGMLLPQSARPAVIGICLVVFVVTYIPLMIKLFRIFKRV